MKKFLAVFFICFFCGICWVSELVYAEIWVESQFMESELDGEFSTSFLGFSVMDLDEEDDLLFSIDPQLEKKVGQVLNYPNPFTLALENTTIGYYLDEDKDVVIQITDQIGNEVYRNEFKAGFNGGLGSDYNRIEISANDFSQIVSAGAYFVTVFSDGKLIGKCKMGILP